MACTEQVAALDDSLTQVYGTWEGRGSLAHGTWDVCNLDY